MDTIIQNTLTNFVNQAELKMFFSTLLQVINNGLHGFLDPDFLQMINPNDRTYFIAQYRYGDEKSAVVQKFIDHVEMTKNDTN
jgi:hypothetical protein